MTLTDACEKSTLWKLAAVIDEAEVYALGRDLVWNSVLMGICISVPLLLLTWLMTRRLMRPINTLAKASGTIANGDLNAPLMNAASAAN